MPYELKLSPRAERQLDRIPDQEIERILTAMQQLSENPRPRGVKKLRARVPAWRIRVGEYRIIYSIFAPDRLIIIDSVLRRTTTTY